MSFGRMAMSKLEPEDAREEKQMREGWTREWLLEAELNCF